jgi:hypothetical protein
LLNDACINANPSITVFRTFFLVDLTVGFAIILPSSSDYFRIGFLGPLRVLALVFVR